MPSSSIPAILSQTGTSSLYTNSSKSSAPTSTLAAEFLRDRGVALVQEAAAAMTTVKAKKVFAHYMLGTVTQEHAQQDIDEAIAMGVSRQ